MSAGGGAGSLSTALTGSGEAQLGVGMALEKRVLIPGSDRPGEGAAARGPADGVSVPPPIGPDVLAAAQSGSRTFKMAPKGRDLRRPFCSSRRRP
jgi:hypothetical protein